MLARVLAGALTGGRSCANFTATKWPMSAAAARRIRAAARAIAAPATRTARTREGMAASRPADPIRLDDEGAAEAAPFRRRRPARHGRTPEPLPPRLKRTLQLPEGF